MNEEYINIKDLCIYTFVKGIYFILYKKNELIQSVEIVPPQMIFKLF